MNETIRNSENVAVSYKTILNSQMTEIVQNIQEQNWENITLPLSEWNKNQLQDLQSSSGIECLLQSWFVDHRNLVSGTYCNGTWDNHYCWPPTPNGTITTRPCSETFAQSHPTFAEHIKGSATRICQENGTWLWGNWTNYTICADNYEAYVDYTREQAAFIAALCQYMLIIGSTLSILCLLIALSIFFNFTSLWCDRIKLHAHLMLALLLRFILLFIITEPFIFQRSSNYRDVDILCKGILCTYLYATVATVGWMFVQGIYLNGKLTTQVFATGTQFKMYYFVGWGIPLVLILVYGITMEIRHAGTQCWKGYSEMNEIWIFIGPIIVVLLFNLGFLINILRVLLQKVQGAVALSGSDMSQFRTAAKATVILFPVLGVNNLIFLYVPSGEYEKYYVVLNTFLSSSQGVFVSIVYCFISHEVHAAMYRSYSRAKIRWDARFSSVTTSHGATTTCENPQPTALAVIHLASPIPIPAGMDHGVA